MCGNKFKKWNLLHSVIFHINENAYENTLNLTFCLRTKMKSFEKNALDWNFFAYDRKNIFQSLLCFYIIFCKLFMICRKFHLILISFLFLSLEFFVDFFSSECTSKSGTSAGTCASGFGVCCTCKFFG